MKNFRKFLQENPTRLSVLISLVLVIILMLIPTSFEEAQHTHAFGGERVKAKVISVDNSSVMTSGLVQVGDQFCTVRIEGGSHKGEEHRAANPLSGTKREDTLFEVGDRALVLVATDGEEVRSVSMIDTYRVDKLGILLILFFALILIIAGHQGLRAILSFVVAILSIWKLLVPLSLKGFNPLVVGGLIAIFIQVITLSLVYGFNNSFKASSLACTLAIVFTIGLALISTHAMKIDGAVMENAESLLYSGYAHINLTQIFIASVVLSASGALMDLCVDITSAVGEVAVKRPDLGSFDLFKSGMTVGKDTMATMTTTLLLAYSGGYLPLLMVFMAQGTPMINMINYKEVSAEILQTLVGSIGLVIATPLTAMTAGYFLARKKEKISN